MTYKEVIFVSLISLLGVKRVTWNHCRSIPTIADHCRSMPHFSAFSHILLHFSGATCCPIICPSIPTIATQSQPLPLNANHCRSMPHFSAFFCTFLVPHA